MTVVEYLQGTRRRFQRQPTPTAARETAAELRRGLRRRRDMLSFRLFGHRTIETNLAGVGATFHAEDRVDAERARTLNREQAVAEWLLADCDGDTVFWDVGAYHGHYSVLAAAKGATVVAFEPGQQNRSRIDAHAKMNESQIAVSPVALSDTDGEAAFGGPGSNEFAVGEGDHTVETRRGDGIEPAPDVVKLDVEGHEIAALDGMKGHLDGVERIAVEVHEGVHVGDVDDRLDAAGFQKICAIGTPRSQPYLAGVRR